MSNYKPCPADFMEVAKRLKTPAAMQEHYGIGQALLYRWARENNHSFRAKEDAPADLAENALHMTRKQLIEHYGVTQKIMIRMLSEAGVTAMRPVIGPPRRNVPEDFTSVAKTMTVKDLGTHYRVSYDVLRRWIKETGAVPKAPDRAAISKAVAAKGFETKRRNAAPKPRRYHTRPVTSDIRKYHNDVYDIAADKLRRLCPVFRCDDVGKYQQAGNFWRVGWSVLTPDELLDKARKMEKAA